MHITDTRSRSAYSFRMMMRLLTIWICQCALFCLGIAFAMLCAQLGGEAVAWAFNIDETIPKAVIFFGSLAIIGLIGNRFWPEGWLGNPLL
jgi:hypothetical protein